jgi:hypothetical protein
MRPKKIVESDKIIKSANIKKAKTPLSSPSLRQQYVVIREDILKLKADLQKGYSIAKGAVEKKKFLKELLES